MRRRTGGRETGRKGVGERRKGMGERRERVGERRSKEKMRKQKKIVFFLKKLSLENDKKVIKHYHLIEYINIIHDKDETDNINDQ